eukprot:g4739.t1
MASKSHLSDSLKREPDDLETVEPDSFSTELVQSQVENTYVVVGASLPTPHYETEEWKTNFPHFFPGCVPSNVPQSGSFLSQICDDMDPQKWTNVGFEDVLSPQHRLPVASKGKRSRSGNDRTDGDELEMKREAEKEKNRERMRRLRAARDDEKIARDREKARERTRRVRASWNEERRQRERQRAREYMRQRRATKAAEIKQNVNSELHHTSHQIPKGA